MPPRKPNLLVVTSPETEELKVLDSVRDKVNVVGVGRTLAELQLDDSVLASIDVLLNCGVGARAGKRQDIEEMWPKLSSLKWLHSNSAGVENLIFPALADSDVVLTNAKGVYSHSLAEYALTCCNWFAKDLPRMRASQQSGQWDPYEVEELRGKTFGVLGYGDIGCACGKLAKAYKMNVIALRRRVELTEAEQQAGVLSKLYAPEQMCEMIAQCDYVLMAMPFTPQTHQLLDAKAIAAMKPTAVFINVGRGKCVDEPALVRALQEGKIRGAGLDVFYQEPLPASSPLWSLDNVLMSPHCADCTANFQFESMQFFVDNMLRFAAGEDLQNTVDKAQGY